MRGPDLVSPALAARVQHEWTSVAGYAAALVVRSQPSPAERLRTISRLPVTALAALAGVSRQTYHGWLVGEPISEERRARLEAIVATIADIATYRDVRSFLKRPIYGTTPQELIVAGKYELAAQLARGALLDAPTEPDVVTPIPWGSPPSDLLVSYLYHIDPAAARPERDNASEIYTDEVIALGSVVITG